MKHRCRGSLKAPSATDIAVTGRGKSRAIGCCVYCRAWIALYPSRSILRPHVDWNARKAEATR